MSNTQKSVSSDIQTLRSWLKQKQTKKKTETNEKKKNSALVPVLNLFFFFFCLKNSKSTGTVPLCKNIIICILESCSRDCNELRRCLWVLEQYEYIFLFAGMLKQVLKWANDYTTAGFYCLWLGPGHPYLLTFKPELAEVGLWAL